MSTQQPHHDLVEDILRRFLAAADPVPEIVPFDSRHLVHGVQGRRVTYARSALGAIHGPEHVPFMTIDITTDVLDLPRFRLGFDLAGVDFAEVGATTLIQQYGAVLGPLVSTGDVHAVLFGGLLTKFWVDDQDHLSARGDFGAAAIHPLSA